MLCGELVVGIFSREDDSTYEWLINVLKKTSGVKDIRPVLITNDWNDFASEVPKCDFAILFHSKRRGRLNITNVEDSLYDRELDHLSRKFGRGNVIVVIGDLQDSSSEQKGRILAEQPDIQALACSLFIFSEINGHQAPFQSDKIRKLQKLISRNSVSSVLKSPCFWVIIVVLLVGGVTGLVVFAVEESNSTHQGPVTLPPVSNTTVKLIGTITITEAVTNTTQKPIGTIAVSATITPVPEAITEAVSNTTQKPIGTIAISATITPVPEAITQEVSSTTQKPIATARSLAEDITQAVSNTTQVP